MNPRSHPPVPSGSSSGVTTSRRIPGLQHSTMQNKTSTVGDFANTMATSTAGHTSRTINVKAIGRADFRSGGKASTGE